MSKLIQNIPNRAGCTDWIEGLLVCRTLKLIHTMCTTETTILWMKKQFPIKLKVILGFCDDTDKFILIIEECSFPNFNETTQAFQSIVIWIRFVQSQIIYKCILPYMANGVNYISPSWCLQFTYIYNLKRIKLNSQIK